MLADAARVTLRDTGLGAVIPLRAKITVPGSPPAGRRAVQVLERVGTRFTYEHTGFTGTGGFVMAKLLGRVPTKMLPVGLPAMLDDMN